MNFWVDVRHRLPPYDKDVLITDGEYVSIGRLQDNSLTKYWFKSEDRRIQQAFFWMQIPELPPT